MTRFLEPLTEQQRYVLNKLTREPQTAFQLQCNLATLRALVRKGVARDVTPSIIGSHIAPRSHFKFVKAGGAN